MISLYIHVPFCVGKCSYCGFYSTPFDRGAASLYLDGLAREASDISRRVSGNPFGTLYIGGGTPSVLTADLLTRFFDVLSASFAFDAGTERTMEANPATLSPEKLSMLRARGIGRLSLGVQSFDDLVLAVLGRPHRAQDAVRSYREARRAGFGCIGLDLIYGIPGQDIATWRKTLEQAIDLSPDHVSAYCLSLDEGSAFHRLAADGALSLPDESLAADMYGIAGELLEAAGLQQYELSNFARPGAECRHNMHYWDRGEYIGLGPGAWSFLDGVRTRNIPDIVRYAADIEAGRRPVDQRDEPDERQAAREFLFLGIRRRDGVSLERFKNLFGESMAGLVTANIGIAGERGLVEFKAGRVFLTRRGRLFADEAALLMLP